MRRGSSAPRRLAALLLSVVCTAAAEHHEAVSAERQQEIVAACTQTNRDYQLHRDRGNAAEYGALFTPDAEFVLSAPLRGREAITAAMLDRVAERQTRHFINIVQLEATGPDTAEGLVYLMVTGAPAGAAPADRKGSVDLVAEYHDRYVMQGTRCLIERRAVDIAFWMAPVSQP